MIDIGAGHQDAGDRRMPQITGVKHRCAFDLQPKVGRSVEQEPLLAVIAKGDLSLRALLCEAFPLAVPGSYDNRSSTAENRRPQRNPRSGSASFPR